jgi:predicted nucleic acid-binding protein
MSGPVQALPRAVTDVVTDASVVVKWYVPEVHSVEARRFLAAHIRRHVPVLLFVEVGQTIWKKVHQRREIVPDDGRQIIRALLATPMDSYPVNTLLEPAFDIALATGRTVYDSIYLALATALDCRLVTADQKFFNAIQNSAFASSILWVADPI